jgi:hypothetical protein
VRGSGNEQVGDAAPLRAPGFDTCGNDLSVASRRCGLEGKRLEGYGRATAFSSGAGSVVGGVRGSRTLKVVPDPDPGRPSAVTVPWWAATMALTIERPRPAPP